MNAYKVLVGKLEGKRPLGRPRRRWKIILKYIFQTVFIFQDRGQRKTLVNTVINFWVP
jgi:hypothetical protein